jgi:acyl-CoA synthetase (AMP-forming)/AMP-acid ligase II
VTELRNLAQAQDEHARLRPHALALIDGELRLSHAQLALAIARTAGHLRAQRITPGTLVGVALADHATHVVIMLALARIGAVMLPLDHRWTAGERERVALHFGAALVLIEPAMPVAGLPNIEVDAAWAQAVDAAAPDPDIAPGGDAPLLVSLSSGTTGRPKGPRITHDHFLARFRTHWVNLGFVDLDCFACATPLYFGGGRTFVWSTLYLGGKVVLTPPPWEPPALLAALEREQVSTLFLVPTQLRRLLAEPTEPTALKALRLLFSSGAPLNGQERCAIRERLNPRFCEYYASTEGGGVTLLTAPDIDEHPDSVGRAVHAVQVQVVDAEHNPLPAGQVGRLRYRSPGCATGFYLDDDASTEAFHEGWFYPGDLAQLDAQGFLTLAGRAKDMVIRNGVNIYPEEVETVLRSHPDVRDAAVIGMPDPQAGEELLACVVLSTAVSPQALRLWCEQHLAPYKVPRQFALLESLPLNSSGKVLKAALRAEWAHLVADRLFRV